MFSPSSHILLRFVILAVAIVVGGSSRGQVDHADDKQNARSTSGVDANNGSSRSTTTATIHWQGVPLGETLERLKLLFKQPVFVDRRVDPNARVTLDMAASSAEQALGGIADSSGLEIARLGKLLYLGPSSAAGRLRPLASLRTRDVARLPVDERSALLKRHTLSWTRLGEPRQLAATSVQQAGWQLANAESIPHDLWPANELPELTMAEELTVLLFGFDLTFEFEADQHTIRIMPLEASVAPARPHSARSHTPAKAPTPRTADGTKQVYTLHVQEKPVGAVLHELANRLHWNLQIDEDAIRAAGKSLDQRVSFSVTNADQDTLLDALLEPAGLEHRAEGDQILVVPQRHDK